MKRRKPKRKLVAEINVVPYIDVTLVLMVIFMITAPLLMPILIWGDASVDYGTVVILMSELQLAGAISVGLVTEPAQQ